MFALKFNFLKKDKALRSLPVRGDSFLNPRFLSRTNHRSRKGLKILEIFAFLRAEYAPKKVTKSIAKVKVSVYSYTPEGIPAVRLKMS